MHSNADGLSRLPLPTTASTPAKGSVDSIFNMAQIQSLPVTATDVQMATRSDPILSKIFQYVRSGWPRKVHQDLQPYKIRQDELGLEGGSLMWGIRVVIPERLQPTVLQALHANHSGISRMKAVARSYFWWSGLDNPLHRRFGQIVFCLSSSEVNATRSTSSPMDMARCSLEACPCRLCRSVPWENVLHRS